MKTYDLMPDFCVGFLCKNIFVWIPSGNKIPTNDYLKNINSQVIQAATARENPQVVEVTNKPAELPGWHPKWWIRLADLFSGHLHHFF